jgi:hypothetical protein
VSLSIMINQTTEDINMISSIKNYLVQLDHNNYDLNESNLTPLDDTIKWLNNILLVLDDPEFGQEQLYDPMELID